MKTTSSCLLLGALALSSAATGQAGAPEGLTDGEWSSFREAYEAARHAIHSVEGGHRARNPGQQWTAHFDERGFSTTPDAGDWTWGLQLQSYGWTDEHRVVSTPQAVSVNGQTLSYDWDEQLSEWFVNDARGLEHGYTVHQRPPRSAADGPLTLALSVRGDLAAKVSTDGRSARFVESSGKAVLSYSGLTVFDADGRSLPARLAAVPGGLSLTVDERGARYPLTIDPIAQQAHLIASNAGEFDQFGVSVSVSGDTVVVGAHYEDSAATGVNGDESDNSETDAGAAYVFVRDGTTWTQQAYLKASNTDGCFSFIPPFVCGDAFGRSVAVSGDTLVVGAPNEGSAATGVNGDQDDESAGFAGAAYVFVRSGTTWTQQAYLKASNTDPGDNFGATVAVTGNTLVIGAPGEDSAATGVNGDQGDDSAGGSGAAYVFVRDGTTWTQQAYLKASNTEAGDRFTHVGTNNFDAIGKAAADAGGGQAVALAADTIVIGASGEDSAATGVNGDESDNRASGAGAAYVFVRNGTTWSQQAYLKASNAEAGDSFGNAVALSGDSSVIGARFEDSGATGIDGDQSDNSADAAGAAYVFVRDGTTWSQQAYLKASNAEGSQFPSLFFPGDQFGEAVALTGETVLVGALNEGSAATGVDGDQGDNSAERAGAAYVFKRSGTTWSQQAYLKASNTTSGFVFGNSVAASGDTLVAGSSREDVSGDFASGATYVFHIEQAECLLVIGDAPGDATFLDVGHVFQTQLDDVQASYAVLMEDIPDFVLPGPDRWTLATAGQAGVGTTGDPVGPADLPEWLWDGEFTIQILLWNPVVFPALPEQFSPGLWVRVLPGGGLVTRPYGSGTGIEVWAETGVNAQGQPVFRFPFSIPGL